METEQKNREAARKSRPRQAAAAGEKQAQPRRSAEQAQERPAAQRRPRQEAPARRQAPKGTGTRKSAPQRTPQQQREAQRRAAQKKKNNPNPNQKRTLKDNSLQNFIAGIKGGNTDQKNGDRAAQAEARRKARAAKAEKKRKQATRTDAPAVIYTQPQPFNRNRLMIQLLTVTAVVVALVIGLSVFFKVGNITVAGAEVYSPAAVVEASGIKVGDNLLTFSRARATAQIQAKLPYVEKSRIGIKLPETVILYIEEMDVAYAIQSGDGIWWLMNSNGRVVEQTNASAAKNYTQVLGVTLSNPQPNEDAIATEELPVSTDSTEEVAPVTVTGAQRLYAALQILQALEANDIVGEAASVDVTRLEDVILWYGNRYQVNLGDTSRMEYKIACMNDAIAQMEDYQSGVLDISFTTFNEKVGFTPFE